MDSGYVEGDGGVGGVLCHVLSSPHYVSWVAGGPKAKPLGLVPGGKGIRAPGGGDVSHSAIW